MSSSKRSSIILVAPHFGEAKDGIAHHSNKLMSSLEKQFDVEVLTSKSSDVKELTNIYKVSE